MPLDLPHTPLHHSTGAGSRILRSPRCVAVVAGAGVAFASSAVPGGYRTAVVGDQPPTRS